MGETNDGQACGSGPVQSIACQTDDHLLGAALTQLVLTRIGVDETSAQYSPTYAGSSTRKRSRSPSPSPLPLLRSFSTLSASCTHRASSSSITTLSSCASDSTRASSSCPSCGSSCTSSGGRKQAGPMKSGRNIDLLCSPKRIKLEGHESELNGDISLQDNSVLSPLPCRKGIKEVVAARLASEKAVPFEYPEKKKGLHWSAMRDEGWHDHFRFLPKLPVKGDWDFEIHDYGPPETVPTLLLEMAQTCCQAAEKLRQKTSLTSGLANQTSCEIKLGLCMSLKNRAEQVKSSLPISLANLWAHRSWCKIYLVDFDSNDGIVDWIRHTFPEAMGEDLLRVYTTKDMPYFHIALAKNTAHRVAIEDKCHILVNLDADNFVDAGFAIEVMTRMGKRNEGTNVDPKGCDVVHYYNNQGFDRGGDGTYGRIAQFASDFEYLRGYDEITMPAGNHDCDLLHRYKMAGRRICGSSKFSTTWWNGCDRTPYPATAIPNTKAVTIMNVSPSNQRFSWQQMQELNSYITHDRRFNRGEMIRNRDRTQYPYMGCKNVELVKPYVQGEELSDVVQLNLEQECDEK